VALQDSLEAGRTAEQVVAHFRAGALDPYFLSETDLLALGNSRLQSGRMKDATVLLEYSAELFPQSYGAASALGDAYRAAGNKAYAIQSYRRSLGLNPRGTEAQQQAAAAVEKALRELEGK
jgi:tetratricopeptide (TPR) repeat protein